MTGGRVRRVRHISEGDVLPHLRRRRQRRRHRALIEFHRKHGKLATLTAVQPRAASAPSRSRRRAAVATLHGKAAGRRRLDQRRLLRPGAARCSTTSRGDETVWEQEPMQHLAQRRRARRLPPHGLLAADGHAARQAGPAEDVGRRRCAVERLGHEESGAVVNQALPSPGRRVRC